MFKNIKTIKNYYKLSNIKLGLVFFQFLFLLMPSIFSVVSPILSANVITEITVYNFSRAIYFLSIDFVLIVCSAISYFIYYLISKKVNKIIFNNLNLFVYDKIRANPNIQKLNASTISNVFVCTEFNKDLLYKLCFLVKSIILISIIFYYNLYIGLAILAVSIIMFFLLRLTDKRIQVKDQKLTDLKISSVELLNSIKKGVQVEHNLGIDNSLKDKYFKYVNEEVETSNKIAFYYNINNNFISLFLKFAVFFSTIFLILQVKSTVLTLSLYLFLTPYLTNSAQNLVAFFEIFTKTGTIENILNEFSSLNYTTQTFSPKQLDISTYNIYFYETTLNEPNLPKILSLQLNIKFGDLVMFTGKENCGKRAIFLLLTKETPTTSGSIFIDNKNIAEIDSENYKKLVMSTTKSPYFYNMSIMENLLLVNGSRNKIMTAIKNFGLKDLIEKLPENINTKINENFNKKLLFFLGLVRAYLGDPKILLIYETPNNMSEKDTSIFERIIKFLKRKKTVIFFSHNEEYGHLFNKIYHIENSEIKLQNLK